MDAQLVAVSSPSFQILLLVLTTDIEPTDKWTDFKVKSLSPPLLVCLPAECELPLSVGTPQLIPPSFLPPTYIPSSNSVSSHSFFKRAEKIWENKIKISLFFFLVWIVFFFFYIIFISNRKRKEKASNQFSSEKLLRNQTAAEPKMRKTRLLTCESMFHLFLLVFIKSIFQPLL